jgi:hypothetical protein
MRLEDMGSVVVKLLRNDQSACGSNMTSESHAPL